MGPPTSRHRDHGGASAEPSFCQRRGRLARERYQAEANQRARAEESLRQAREIVDFFTGVSRDEMADRVELQPLRRMMLAAALDYYQDFIEQVGDNPSLQKELAASHLNVASILDAIGSKDEALEALEKARTNPGEGRSRSTSGGSLAKQLALDVSPV